MELELKKFSTHCSVWSMFLVLVGLVALSTFTVFLVSPNVRTTVVKHSMLGSFTSSFPSSSSSSSIVAGAFSSSSPPFLVPNSSVSHLLQKTQNPQDCDKVKKFLVYRMPKINGKDTRNLGAMLTTLWRWVLLALADDRVVVIDSYEWNMADCKDNFVLEKGGLNCYFLPFSTCDMSHVLKVLPSEKHVVLSLEPEKIRKDFALHVVVVAPVYSPAMAEDFIELDHGRLRVSGDDCQVMLAIVAFFLRFNTRTWETISSNLQASLPSDFDSDRSIGIPIRASDKCIGHALADGSASGEMKCYNFEYYMKLAEELRLSTTREEKRGKNKELNTIILTSEDPKIIAESKKFALSEKGRMWRFIYNSRDVLQGTGSSTSVTKSEALRNQHRNISHWEVATSMFTSLILQLQGRYLITHAKSSFLLLMGFLHQYCEQCGESPKTTVWIRPLLMCNILNITNKSQRVVDSTHTASVFSSLPRDAIVADH